MIWRSRAIMCGLAAVGKVPRCARDDTIFFIDASSRRTASITPELSSRAQRGTFPTAANPYAITLIIWGRWPDRAGGERKSRRGLVRERLPGTQAAARAAWRICEADG